LVAGTLTQFDIFIVFNVWRGVFSERYGSSIEADASAARGRLCL
jgi:hypothetical protein